MRTRRTTLPIILLFLAPVLAILVAVALSARHDTTHEAFIMVPFKADWHGRWETGAPGVKLIPLYVTPPRRVVAGFARDIESPAVAKETIERLGLKMTPEELLENLTVEPDPESADVIRLTYRDPTAERAEGARTDRGRESRA
jgi:hypothetical protein